MSFLNRECKTCGTNYHQCSSCGIDDIDDEIREKGFCSKECMIESWNDFDEEIELRVAYEKIKELKELKKEYELTKGILDLIGRYELWDGEIFTIDGEFLVNCNDIFMWACADAEELESWDDINLFHQCVKDCTEQSGDHITGETKGGLLYCARRRKMRPQGAVYEKIIPKRLWSLFDECGPPREAGFGNPVDRDKLEE